jgi:CRP/FNR family transcriptional regulator
MMSANGSSGTGFFGDHTVYTFLNQLSESSRRELRSATVPLSGCKGDVLLREGDRCDPILLIGGGALRVHRTAHDGREITLYRVEPGELCVLALCAALGGRPYAATATVADDLQGFGIPARTFRTLFATEDGVRGFVVDMFSQRLEESMLLVSEVAFARMDQRLAKLLLTHAASDSSDGGNLHVTHQELAAELGTAREVVSRILRSFADQGLVTVSRGHVRLIDEQALRGLLPEGP